ncbi:MAG: GIY-YIG nuclease family protein [Anaerolineales bacterium]|nr:GIY-YIG nuclease family protein [Anaerolineales bacterium]
MTRRKSYFVYIMCSKKGTLYTGVTGDLEKRVYAHKHKLVKGFTSKYDICRLVYFEGTSDVYEALSREKQIKGWRREKKLTLIESVNPTWLDLSEGWFEEVEDT